jgi:2-haloalkanoic acid dehalogenase type II
LTASARSTGALNERLPPPRALFFDLDDTLADFTSARRAALLEVADQIAAASPGVSVDAIVAERRARGATIAQATDLEARRRQVWAQVLRAVGAEGRFEPAGLTALHDRLTQKRLALFPDAALSLSRATTAFELTGIITNGPSETQWAEVHALHLEPRVGRVIVAGDVGAFKPDPAIFAAALRNLKIEPREAVFVGNSPTHDIAGALRSGWRAVWLNRGNEPYPTGLPRPSAVISTLTDLFELFGG